MEIFKKSFLFVVGIAVIAFVEIEKEINKDRGQMKKIFKHDKPKEKPTIA